MSALRCGWRAVGLGIRNRIDVAFGKYAIISLVEPLKNSVRFFVEAGVFGTPQVSDNCWDELAPHLLEFFMDKQTSFLRFVSVVTLGGFVS